MGYSPENWYNRFSTFYKNPRDAKLAVDNYVKEHGWDWNNMTSAQVGQMFNDLSHGRSPDRFGGHCSGEINDRKEMTLKKGMLHNFRRRFRSH